MNQNSKKQQLVELNEDELEQAQGGAIEGSPPKLGKKTGGSQNGVIILDQDIA